MHMRAERLKPYLAIKLTETVSASKIEDPNKAKQHFRGTSKAVFDHMIF